MYNLPLTRTVAKMGRESSYEKKQQSHSAGTTAGQTEEEQICITIHRFTKVNLQEVIEESRVSARQQSHQAAMERQLEPSSLKCIHMTFNNEKPISSLLQTTMMDGLKPPLSERVHATLNNEKAPVTNGAGRLRAKACPFKPAAVGRVRQSSCLCLTEGQR